MPYLSNTALIVIVGVGAFLVIAKLLKAEKGAALLVLAAVIIWLLLYLTGYDKTVKQIIFDAPAIQPAGPEDLRNR
jgi:apolipoprotein N-acyltransferase